MADIAHLLVSESSPTAVLDAVADALGEVVPHDALTLYTADPAVRLLHPALVRDARSEETLTSGPLQYGEGVAGSAAESGKSRLVNLTGPVNGAHTSSGAAAEPHSLIVNPLTARGELKGVLCLYRFGQDNVFTEEEFNTAIRFSGLAALAIDNADIRSKLESLAMTDHLTGLYNHRYFQERLLEEVSRANRYGRSVSLVIYDIDDFKRVNDSYGHLLGDQVLQGVASSAGRICRIEDPVCRIGGEEFAVILPGQARTQALALAERIRLSIVDLRLPMQTRVTVSLGAAEAPANASSPRDLFACADLALRTAKAQGKNRVCAYAGRALGPRHDSSEDHPLSGRWEILAEGVETSPRPRRGTERTDRGGPRPIPEDRSIAQMEMLHRVSSNLNQVQDPARIAHTISVELRSLIDYRSCRVYLLAEDGGSLALAALPGAPQPQGGDPENQTDGLSQPIAGEAARSGQTIYVADTSNSPLRARTADASRLIESLLAAPLRFDDHVIGVIVLSKLGVDEFDEDDARLLEVMASIAAIALRNASLFDAHLQAARTLEGAYLSTVEALANALEAQDEYTSDHARALAQMALSVGSDLGLKEADLSSLELAALFHDIGKIGVPSEIIRKPGPLTADEWREMRRHPEIGERILAPVAFLQPIRPMVRACHERWDGRGYPDGLSGERIPLQARIVFVCDAFHAMSTDRSYRSALPQDEAIRRILAASGSQFDPRVARAFCQLFEQGSIGFGPDDDARDRYSHTRLGSWGGKTRSSTVR
jgi:diguanylate cyclase (GGDEF)-like protein